MTCTEVRTIVPTPKLNAALVAARAEMGRPAKNKTADTGKYSFDYADLAAVDALAMPVLAKHGLSYLQNLDTVASPEGILVGAQTVLVHSSGESFYSTFFRVPARDGSAQSTCGAATQAKRYSLCGVLGIIADDDDDANGIDGTGGRVTSRGPAAQARPSTAPRPSAGAAIQQQVEGGFDRVANKKAVMAAMTSRGMDTPALRNACFKEAENYKGKSFSTFTPAECNAFLGAINEGRYDYVVTGEVPAEESEGDLGNLPV